jgi:putative aldouronate transport system permease protein
VAGAYVNMSTRKGSKKSKLLRLKKDFSLYLLILPALLSVFVFNYIPLPGISIAFMDFDIIDQFNSPWAGFKHFQEIVTIPQLKEAAFNTLKLGVLSLITGFPLPIIFALMLNELKNGIFKRTVQTISYLPHFLSWATVIGIAYTIYSKYGPINDLLVWITGDDNSRILFLGEQGFFVPNVLLLQIWKNLGWNTIIYLAALTSIDPELYEASYIDGAGRLKQIIYITIPGIKQTVIMLLILACGGILNDNFQLVYGLQNAFIDYEVISTIVYKQGLQQSQYSMATAFGLTLGLVSFLLTWGANKVSKKVSEISIW